MAIPRSASFLRASELNSKSRKNKRTIKRMISHKYRLQGKLILQSEIKMMDESSRRDIEEMIAQERHERPPYRYASKSPAFDTTNDIYFDEWDGVELCPVDDWGCRTVKELEIDTCYMQRENQLIRGIPSFDEVWGMAEYEDYGIAC